LIFKADRYLHKLTRTYTVIRSKEKKTFDLQAHDGFTEIVHTTTDVNCSFDASFKKPVIDSFLPPKHATFTTLNDGKKSLLLV